MGDPFTEVTWGLKGYRRESDRERERETTQREAETGRDKERERERANKKEKVETAHGLSGRQESF